MKYFFQFFFAAFILSTSQAQTIVPLPGIDTIKNIPADSSSKLHIAAINVTGNKKTKTYIILKEIPFKSGDSITAGELYKNLLAAKQLVYNTSLFTEVKITPEFISAAEIKLNVTVKEKWYIYPTPQFQLVDRNFNEWLKVYNGSLDRVIYGAKFAHYNLSGRRDQLRIYLLNGYARNISFSYLAPASNTKLTEGFGISAGYTQNREIAYRTNFDNKLLQYKNEKNFVRNVFSTAASYLVRKGYYKRHVYRFGYSYLNVTDTILSPAYNPGYLNSSKSSVGYPDFIYAFQYSNTDNINYPLKGKIYGVSFLKRGLALTGGINLFSVDAAFYKYFAHGHDWYSSVELDTKLKLPFKQAFINQRALGFQEFYLRGLEYYVVDGVAAALAKYTLKKKIISFKIPVPFHIKTLPAIPFTIFAKTYADAGYSYIKREFDTRLNNRLLYTGGFGIDILTLYDINLKIEYSFNQLGENGLFLHTRGGF
ncbi:MAG: POTRA domain-containing protein [Ferruginibacter sp.]